MKIKQHPNPSTAVSFPTSFLTNNHGVINTGGGDHASHPLPRHSHSLQCPPGQLPKLFQPLQMAVISLHPVRDHVHNRNISLSSGDRLMMLWRHSSHRIAVSPSSAGALEQAAVMSAPTSPKSQRSSAGSKQLIPGNSCLQALISPAAIAEMQVGHSAPWLLHVLEHDHHTHLCTLMGKEKNR